MFRPCKFFGVDTFQLCSYCPIEMFDGLDCSIEKDSKFLGKDPNEMPECGFLFQCLDIYDTEIDKARLAFEKHYEDNLKSGTLF